MQRTSAARVVGCASRRRAVVGGSCTPTSTRASRHRLPGIGAAGLSHRATDVHPAADAVIQHARAPACVPWERRRLAGSYLLPLPCWSSLPEHVFTPEHLAHLAERYEPVTAAEPISPWHAEPSRNDPEDAGPSSASASPSRKSTRTLGGLPYGCCSPPRSSIPFLLGKGGRRGR
jgi:hypothetical protein